MQHSDVPMQAPPVQQQQQQQQTAGTKRSAEAADLKAPTETRTDPVATMSPEMIAMLTHMTTEAMSRVAQQQQQQARDAAGRFAAAADAAAAAAAAAPAAAAAAAPPQDGKVWMDPKEVEELRALKRAKESEDAERAKKGLETLRSVFAASDPNAPSAAASAQFLAQISRPEFMQSHEGRQVLIQASALAVHTPAPAAQAPPAGTSMLPPRNVVGPTYTRTQTGYYTSDAALAGQQAPVQYTQASAAQASQQQQFAQAPLSQVDQALDAFAREQFKEQAMAFMHQTRRNGATVVRASATDARVPMEPGAVIVHASANSTRTTALDELTDIAARGHEEISRRLCAAAISNTSTVLKRHKDVNTGETYIGY